MEILTRVGEFTAYGISPSKKKIKIRVTKNNDSKDLIIGLTNIL